MEAPAITKENPVVNVAEVVAESLQTSAPVNSDSAMVSCEEHVAAVAADITRAIEVSQLMTVRRRFLLLGRAEGLLTLEDLLPMLTI